MGALSTSRRCAAEHNGEHKVKDFSCLDLFFAMAFINAHGLPSDDHFCNLRVY
ncbi:DUF4372 domain-containing protein [Rhodoferax sp.]|uniref:DUF4372 domain-containing protein n=1 Tax=Rhodoferax sp. TaxID=50421 RepID=UPI00351D3887